jgi:hypothetical protein
MQVVSLESLLLLHLIDQLYHRLVLAYGPSGYNKDVIHTYVFRTYDHPHPSPLAPKSKRTPHLNPGNATAEEIWKVARATSAAPKYFDPITFGERTFRDGAIGANNPAEVAFGEVLQMHRYSPKMLISIGTGLKSGNITKKNTSKLAKPEGWRNLAKLMTNLITQSELTENKVQTACEREEPDVDYYRWNVPGAGDVHLDEWEPPTDGSLTKAKLREFAEVYLSSVDVHLSLVKAARKLVSMRRKRAATERWESFAQRNVYFCPEPSCHHLRATQTFLSREKLRNHGIHQHCYIINVKVKNRADLRHACLFDKCSHGEIHVFNEQAEFEKHLIEYHGVRKPEFMSPRKLEAWLDLGRMTQQEAIRRHDSMEAQETEEAGGSHSGKGKARGPPVRTWTHKGSVSLKPPDLNTPGTSISSTQERSSANHFGDDHAESSRHSATPSPSRSQAEAGASQEFSERNDSLKDFLGLSNVTQVSPTPSPQTTPKRRRLRNPFQKPWVVEYGHE